LSGFNIAEVVLEVKKTGVKTGTGCSLLRPWSNYFDILVVCALLKKQVKTAGNSIFRS